MFNLLKFTTTFIQLLTLSLLIPHVSTCIVFLRETCPNKLTKANKSIYTTSDVNIIRAFPQETITHLDNHHEGTHTLSHEIFTYPGAQNKFLCFFSLPTYSITFVLW